MTTAPALLLLVASGVAWPGTPRAARALHLHGDPAVGRLVNLTPGARPSDPPDPARATVVFVHGFNPVPRLVHFTMAESLARVVAARGGPPRNLLAWNWNAATYAGLGLNPRRNEANTRAQGACLAAALAASRIDPARLHLIGHSAGGLLATAAAHDLVRRTRRRTAQLTLLESAAFHHDTIFEALDARSLACRVENYWVPGPGGFGREARMAGVLDVRIDAPAPLLGAVSPLHSAHLYAFHWYVQSAADAFAPCGYNVSVFAPGAP